VRKVQNLVIDDTNPFDPFEVVDDRRENGEFLGIGCERSITRAG